MGILRRLQDKPLSLMSTDVCSVGRQQCSWEVSSPWASHIHFLGQWVHISFTGIQNTMICLQWDMAPVSNLAIFFFSLNLQILRAYSVQSSWPGVKDTEMTRMQPLPLGLTADYQETNSHTSNWCCWVKKYAKMSLEGVIMEKKEGGHFRQRPA